MPFRRILRACALSIPLIAAAAPAAALAPSSPGSVDPGYGTAGVLALGVRSGYETAYRILPLPDGRFLVSGSAQSAGGQDGSRWLARLGADGRPDPTWGNQGILFDGYYTRVLAVQPSGKILSVRTIDADGLTKALLHRLLPDGSRDLAFGVASGQTIVTSGAVALRYQDFEDIGLDAQGRIVATTRTYNADYSISRVDVWRFSADGVPDATFGSQGRSSLADIATVAYNAMVRAQPDGKLVVATWCQASQSASTSTCVLRVNADGTRDLTFGPNGLRKYDAVTGSYPCYGLLVAPSGKIFVSGSNYGAQPATGFVLGLNADGTPNLAWGTGGKATLTSNRYALYLDAMALQADGRLVVMGNDMDGSADTWGFFVRFTAAGVPDPQFGVAGRSARVGAAATSYDGFATLADGSLLAGGQRYNATTANGTDVDSIFVRYVGVEITTPVVEFYNAALNHYFITADPNEAAAIDAGGAGPGWTRTGQTFKSGGPSRVCRFYGSPDINPATGQRRGPNSHFYTIETAECVAVKADAGWRFESYDFNGWPLANGACPAGTVAIKRAYNGRFAQNDSNHRYTTSDTVYQQMVAQGWSGEGTVFCAVP